MITPLEFCQQSITRWEGGGKRGYYSDDPDDNGNWYMPGARQQLKGQGTLVGSNYGVTGATLFAAQGGIITATRMKAITLATAATIGAQLFYAEPGIVNLGWNPVVASILDFGWGAGPGTAKLAVQDMCDTNMDGKIGVDGETAKELRRLIAVHGLECVAGMWHSMREKHYENLAARRPGDAKFLKGWDNRSDYFLPGHPEGFWVKFGR